MSGHTPGPWIYDEDASEILSGSEASGWIWIADVANSVPTGETQANARLIAEAPALLALLKEIRKWMDGEVMGAWDAKFIAEIDTLIAKAEGR